MAQIADKTGSKKTLTDSDISTYQRRSGPSGGVVGTDADAHVTPQAGHDADASPKAGRDVDAAPARDRDA
ncbi:MAG: hypothetical protein ACMUJJ_05620 [Roseicyclus sp.]|uniref:hypothetical protein n=1 Tax=Roseicyclus sp. TaxID=1914329 RepID=UPI003A85A51C